MDLPRRGASNESEFFVYLIAGVVMSTAGRPKFGSWTAAALELGSVIARRRILIGKGIRRDGHLRPCTPARVIAQRRP